MSKAAHIMVALIITATLISGDYFINASLAAYFFFVIAASVLFTVTGIYFLSNKNLSVQINFLPLALIVLLAGYFFLQTLLSAREITTIHIYLFTNALLLFSLALLFKNKILNE